MSHARALPLALAAGLFFGAPAQAQVSGLELRGYYLNVALGSVEGPFSPAGLTDFQRLRLGLSPGIGIVALDVAYEQALSLYTDAELAGARFASLGAIETSTRWLPLQGTIAEGDHARWTHRVDRLSLSVPIGDRITVSAGREAVSWATTLFLTPADPFSPFDPADPFRDYRAGVDVARLRVYAGAFTEFDAILNPTEVDGRTNLTALVRGITLVGPVEVGGWGGIIYDRAGAAASATLTAGGTAFRGEATVRDEPDRTVWRAAVGTDRNFAMAGRDLYVALEYQYDGFGAASGDEIIPTVLSLPFRRGELQVLGRHATAFQAAWQATPLWSVEGLALWNLSDGSLLVSPAVSLSLSNEVTGRAGVYLGLGSETVPAPPLPGAPRVELPASEYGIVPGSLYLSVTAFF